MWSRIAPLLSPPHFEDRDKNRLASALYRVLLGTMAVCLMNLAFGGALSPRPLRSSLLNLSFCLLVVAAMWIVRTGRLGLAMILLATSLWVMVTFAAVVLVGINTPILTAYLAVAVLVGFFSGTRALVAYSVLTSAFIFVATWAESRGLMPETVTEFTAYTAWMSLTAGLAITSILIALSHRATRDALDEARRSERTAVETSLELEASSALLETRARQQATVAELGQLAMADTPPPELIDIAARAVGHTLDVEVVSVLERSEDGEAFLLRAGTGWDDALLGKTTIPIERASQAGHTLLAGEPVVVEDWSRETRFSKPAGFPELGIVSSLSVVIQGTAQPYGVFGVHATSHRRFTDDDVHFLQSVANLLTLLMRRVEVDEALRESEEGLRQAQKMEAIGHFAGGIAHDFNNLLTAILGYAGILKRRLDPEDPAFEDVQEIDHAANGAADLVRQILAFSRRQVLQTEVVDLNEIIRKTKGMLERILSEDVSLSIALTREPATVRADPGQIEQVLMNLAANARDAMPRGGRLEIETANVTLSAQDTRGGSAIEPGPYVRLVVSDTGIGMNEETRAQAFEPFFTTKEISEGTGLGLSTVYGIVTQSGGEISVASEPRSWTRFVIHLPRCTGDEDAPAAHPHVPSTPRGDETVLLVEDEPRVRKLTRRMIEDLGYEVIEAANGREALVLAAEYCGFLPLLVTDVIMPELGGTELVERLSAIHPETRVVYVSGYDGHALGQDRLGRPGTAFLPKPFTREELAQKLREVLE
ncbi:MAG: response regulator [Deltaproteobacteria bacterium]|nr:response regulator [Deltaproteobacteria bacterium]MBW2421414.1 response regulator [Deltaproteobacteria bacterium]